MKIFSHEPSDSSVINEVSTSFTKQEKPATKKYMGLGYLHYVENSEERTFTWDSHVYSISVENAGRDTLNLLFTNEEVEQAARRARLNKNILAQPRSVLDIILSGELWRFFKI